MGESREFWGDKEAKWRAHEAQKAQKAEEMAQARKQAKKDAKRAARLANPPKKSYPDHPLSIYKEGQRIPEEEEHAIIWHHVLHGGSATSLAQMFGRTDKAVIKVLDSPKYTELQRKHFMMLKVERQNRLRTLSDKAITAWEKSLDIAAQKGDHRPSKDLLFYQKVCRRHHTLLVEA